MSVTEKESLPQLLRAIHELTGIKVAIYNLDYDEIMAYPDSSVDFCEMLRRVPDALKACNASERERCEACKACVSSKTMECHAGLTEIVIPIENSGAVVGYIMLGQFVGEKDRELFLSRVQRRCVGYGLSPEQIMENAKKVPCCTDAQMQSIEKIVDVIASYIVFSGLLYPSQTPLKQSILDYIAKNLSEDLSILGLCRKFAVSKSELYRIMRHAAPEGVAAYVRRLRFRKACELLRYTRKPVWQVAAEVGYDNPDYFLRAFKKEMGISAGKYRKGQGGVP